MTTPAFLDGKYLLVFVGTTNGVVECDSFVHFQNTMGDMYPNPGDHVRGHFLNARNWQVAEADDMPYFCEYGVFDETDDYRVFAVRKLEIES